jgi:hypothetical protein
MRFAGPVVVAGRTRVWRVSMLNTFIGTLLPTW